MKMISFFNRGRSFSTRVPELLPKDSTITRVRIWKSGYYDVHRQFIHTNVVTSFISSLKPGRQSNIGHVSIETRDLYASLWPEGIDLFNKLKPQVGEANTSSPAKDEFAEGKPPDILIDLHTLDVMQIQKELIRFVKSGSTYHLIGSNRFFKALGANSCSGLAYDLLSKSGIQKLIKEPNFVRDYVITTPNNLANLILEAQKNERELLGKNSVSTPSSSSPSNTHRSK